MGLKYNRSRLKHVSCFKEILQKYEIYCMTSDKTSQGEKTQQVSHQNETDETMLYLVPEEIDGQLQEIKHQYRDSAVPFWFTQLLMTNMCIYWFSFSNWPLLLTWINFNPSMDK